MNPLIVAMYATLDPHRQAEPYRREVVQQLRCYHRGPVVADLRYDSSDNIVCSHTFECVIVLVPTRQKILVQLI